MTDTSCSYTGHRDDVLIAYLYDDDIDPVVRSTFDAHLAACDRCQADLEDLRGVRVELAQWAPPQPSFAVVSRQSPVVSRQSSVVNPAASRQAQAPAWRSLPAWAQVAAALLFLGVSAGMANLNVHYGADGLTVRTGWSLPAPAKAAPETSPAKTAESAPWRADLTALEQQMRGEFRTASLAAAPAGAAPIVRNASAASSDADLGRRIRALEDATRAQKNDFSLQLAAALRDVSAQRRADLVRIDQNLGLIQNNTGIEVAKNREMLNYVLRVSSQK